MRIQLVSQKHLFRLQRKFPLSFNAMQQGNHIVCQLLKIFINTIFLHESIVPARVHADVLAKAEEAATKIADHLELVGTLAVEMFVLENDEIIINELAPRPHNSGHYSIEACNVSQFHQHIRAICGWPLRKPKLWAPSIMVNVLGEHVAPLKNVVARIIRIGPSIYTAKRKRKKNVKWDM